MAEQSDVCSADSTADWTSEVGTDGLPDRTFQLLSVSFELCLTKSVGLKVVDSIMDANSPCGSVCGLLFPVCYTDVAVVEGALSL